MRIPFSIFLVFILSSSLAQSGQYLILGVSSRTGLTPISLDYISTMPTIELEWKLKPRLSLFAATSLHSVAYSTDFQTVETAQGRYHAFGMRSTIYQQGKLEFFLQTAIALDRTAINNVKAMGRPTSYYFLGGGLNYWVTNAMAVTANINFASPSGMFHRDNETSAPYNSVGKVSVHAGVKLLPVRVPAR